MSKIRNFIETNPIIKQIVSFGQIINSNILLPLNAKIYTPVKSKISNFLEPVTTPIAKFFLPITSRYSGFKKSFPTLGKYSDLGLKIILWSFIALFFLVTLTSWGAFGKMPNAEDLRNIQNSTSTEIYTSDSVLIGKFYIENRTEINLENISPYVITALLAVEDKRFFEHSGIDLRSWLRVFKGMTTSNQSMGGGSTISQQLAKNLFPRKRYKVPGTSLFINKIRENIISIKLERIYNKEEIINLYLNTVPFGGDRFGINVASKYFYNKKASELDAQEAATLVGMLKASTALDPTRNPENSKKRRDLVLQRMLDNKDFVFNNDEIKVVSSLLERGKINEKEYAEYLEKPLGAKRFNTEYYEGIAPYLREYLRTTAMPKLLAKYLKEDGTSWSLYRDGLKIYTTIDSKMQKYAEESVLKHMVYLQDQFGKHWKGYPNEKPWGDDKWLEEQVVRSERFEKLTKSGYDKRAIDSIFKKVKVPMTIFSWKKGGGDIDTMMTPYDSIKHYFLMLNTGFMAMDHTTGHVKAWVGGTNFKYFRYDHILSTRQVGSTFKPIVYAAAIKDSLRPCQYFKNDQRTYGDWTPKNSDNRYGGWYSMVGGLTYSVNTIAARLIEKVGIQKTLDLAKAMGVTSTLPREFGISLGSADISLFDMMKVYGTIANDGIRPEPLTVLKVTDREGNIIYDYEKDYKEKANKIQALTKDEADIVARMLRSVIDNGTGNKLRSQYVPEGEFSGKTGTTQNHSDGWFISFNEKLTTGCWVGGPSPAVRFRTMDLGRGGAMALPIVGNFWYKLLKDKKYNKLALAKFEENEKANNATGCPFRLGINPDQLYVMMQDTNMANEIRARRYRGLKELAEEYFGTPVEEEEAAGGEEVEGGEVIMAPAELKPTEKKPIQITPQTTPSSSTPTVEPKKKGGGGG